MEDCDGHAVGTTWNLLQVNIEPEYIEACKAQFDERW
jgi:hypothetical protein